MLKANKYFNFRAFSGKNNGFIVLKSPRTLVLGAFLVLSDVFPEVINFPNNWAATFDPLACAMFKKTKEWILKKVCCGWTNRQIGPNSDGKAFYIEPF